MQSSKIRTSGHSWSSETKRLSCHFPEDNTKASHCCSETFCGFSSYEYFLRCYPQLQRLTALKTEMSCFYISLHKLFKINMTSLDGIFSSFDQARLAVFLTLRPTFIFSFNSVWCEMQNVSFLEWQFHTNQSLNWWVCTNTPQNTNLPDSYGFIHQGFKMCVDLKNTKD